MATASTERARLVSVTKSAFPGRPGAHCYHAGQNKDRGHFVTLFEVWQSAPGNEADLLAILDHIPTPIVCSALGDAVRTLYINRQFERTFGYRWPTF